MNLDSHYIMGCSHKVCQDYATTGNGVAALSDGCSIVLGQDGKQVVAHTDVGARLLVHSVISGPLPLSVDLAVNRAEACGCVLRLPRYTMSATLLSISATGGSFDVVCAGDGVIAARTIDGKWAVYAVTFNPIPCYPIYSAKQREECGSPIVTRIDIDGDTYCDVFPIVRTFYGCDLVVCMSDGALSFTKDGCQVPFDMAFASRLLDFRRMKGRFVLRHLTGIIRDLAAEGIVNQDDISMIAIHDDGASNG